MVKKLLFLKSNPVDTKDLRLENEEKKVISAWEGSKNRNEFMVIPRGAVTKEELTNHLHEHQPMILHISGHGSSDKNLFLEDSEGYKEEIPFKKFLGLIENFNEVKCLFLNTCHSLNTDDKVKTKIPYVIGMKDKVPNSYAIKFSTEFYKAIFGGQDVHNSFSTALDYMDLSPHPIDQIPKLIAGSGTGEELTLTRTGNLFLVSEEEISKAKSIQKTIKKWFVRAGMVALGMGIALLVLAFSLEGSNLLLQLSPIFAPLILGTYPAVEIVRRTERISILELFELKLLRFKKAISKLSMEDIEKLNEEFFLITKA